MDTEDAERLCDKVAQLDADDPVRRGLLERLSEWWLERKESRRRKQEQRIKQKAQRIAY